MNPKLTIEQVQNNVDQAKVLNYWYECTGHLGLSEKDAYAKCINKFSIDQIRSAFSPYPHISDTYVVEDKDGTKVYQMKMLDLFCFFTDTLGYNYKKAKKFTMELTDDSGVRIVKPGEVRVKITAEDDN